MVNISKLHNNKRYRDSVLLNYLLLVANECVQKVKTFDEIVTNVMLVLVLTQACEQ